jgi:putative peptide modification system cyclase
MNALAATAQAPSPAPAQATPQLRTLLLTDLVDSTGTVERLGDGPAAELFRAHDRLVLDLQQRWRGRLIDRSDGLLLLFERAIDGLGFALDYHRGLRELGQAHGVPLQARAGLHVGEVLTWRNSAEAVAVGAKPLEVEGLAKPLAGRLLGLARPGQILLSATAEALAHRAARELGERGAQLAWKSHGRWRFKGVPEPLEVYEAGEPGLAPLQAPRADAKAWRDIPFWRRPAALAAELALVAVVAIGIWLFTRPQPAIAFSERDWVVVADMRNLTGQPVLDDALQQAFRISLEQSRHVNVLSDLKARDTLARMQRPPDTALDRAVASEIAVRDGARAVILPTVAEVGGRVRVSAEVIDPQSQTTVYAEYADGSGLGSVLASVDAVTAALRARLGEEIKAIERDSEPLPQVSTANLDALRAYALGQKAFARGDDEAALRFYRHATDRDPEFALAWIGQVRALYSGVQTEAAMPALRKAQQLRDRLAPREALYVDAWVLDFDQPAAALAKWRELAQLYPDFMAAQVNTAWALFVRNEFEAALPYIQRWRGMQSESRGMANDMYGRVLLAQGKHAAAIAAFAEAEQLGYAGARRRLAAAYAAADRPEMAERTLARTAPTDRYPYLDKVALAADRGRWPEMRRQAERMLELVGNERGLDSRAFLMPVAVADWLAGDFEEARRKVSEAAQRALDALASEYDPDALDDAQLALSAAIFAQRLGDHSVARNALAELAGRDDLRAHPSVSELETVVRANQLRSSGQPRAAIELLRPLVEAESARFETMLAMLDAAQAAGDVQLALAQVQQLRARRGLAYIQSGCDQCLQAYNVAAGNIALLRESELRLESGDVAGARMALAGFDQRWPPRILPAYLRTRRDALVLASK